MQVVPILFPNRGSNAVRRPVPASVPMPDLISILTGKNKL